jgi:hypothetical protein
MNTRQGHHHLREGAVQALWNVQHSHPFGLDHKVSPEFCVSRSSKSETDWCNQLF